MKIPQSMMNDLIDTVMASLPYEDEQIPVSAEAKVILDLYDVMEEYLPGDGALKGHMQFQLKTIDNNIETQEGIHNALDKVFDVLKQYFVPKEGISHEL